ncbi:MAG TPA: ATP-binding cassette domain-containing protein [Clostridia bacterium]|nr:ATP-binding cassette domain-containing protein [Clostridia bacterium]HPY44069.1 ATP-binding cassette domain-containing protein [Clostridia bacterium]HQA97625.1 ATP-binding cassette domain-containing protein [Clostridia bacterium]HQO55501.1 ATP-binding cassette domain-containing protein [Clostridia bacterium]HUM61163.1 ATP-binding cassette domain-containing protein [Clostridia bacterium]
MSQQVLIAVNGLSKVFQDAENRVIALNDINLQILEGQIYGIVGMSGAGKSTLIRCINRLDTPNRGQILYRGQDILTMDRKTLLKTRRKIGMIFQQFNLFMQRTVSRNIRYPMEIAGVPKKQADRRVCELLEIVGLEDKADAYPAQLSGGQRQRVGIARALASNPDVLLCDEATSALDPMTTQAILSLLQDINRRLGITILLITHEMAVIRQICHRVAILDGGQVAEEGEVDQVFLNTKSEAGKRLFGVLPESEQEDPDVPSLRIVFDGAAAERPIISRLSQETGVAVNILSANMNHLQGKMYGQMIIQKPVSEDENKTVISFLKQEGLTVREVNTL